MKVKTRSVIQKQVDAMGFTPAQRERQSWSRAARQRRRDTRREELESAASKGRWNLTRLFGEIAVSEIVGQ